MSADTTGPFAMDDMTRALHAEDDAADSFTADAGASGASVTGAGDHWGLQAMAKSIEKVQAWTERTPCLHERWPDVLMCIVDDKDKQKVALLAAAATLQALLYNLSSATSRSRDAVEAYLTRGFVPAEETDERAAKTFCTCGAESEFSAQLRLAMSKRFTQLHNVVNKYMPLLAPDDIARMRSTGTAVAKNMSHAMSDLCSDFTAALTVAHYANELSEAHFSVCTSLSCLSSASAADSEAAHHLQELKAHLVGAMTWLVRSLGQPEQFEQSFADASRHLSTSSSPRTGRRR